jgi:hypothetical protein
VCAPLGFRWVFQRFFQPSDPSSVTVVTGDGHEQVLTTICKSSPTSTNKSGAPRKRNAEQVPYTNGSCLVVQQFEPDNTEVVYKALEKRVCLYMNLSTFAYDRNCTLPPAGEQTHLLVCIQSRPSAKMQGHKHVHTCKNSPLHALALIPNAKIVYRIHAQRTESLDLGGWRKI